jgi:hypothetical protein
MRKRGVGTAAVLVTAVALLAAPSAFAATEVGSRCVGNAPGPGFTVISLAGGGSDPLPATFPSSGVITSWSYNLGLSVPPGLLSEQLKVFRSTGAPKQFLVVAESPLSPVAVGPNTFPVRMPVKAGDYLGTAGMAEGEPVTVACVTSDEGDRGGLIMGNPGTGTTTTVGEEAPEIQNPVVATVEPDADGDGFGDETQDKCPTNASTQAACPVPPPPPPVITLSSSATAGKRLATVTVTATAQATVTVGGKVSLGKGKPAKLNGGTQLVAPGSLAKFVVLFPAKLETKLKALSRGHSLPLKLAVTAPGATEKKLTVKVKGQAKPPPRHRKG